LSAILGQPSAADASIRAADVVTLDEVERIVI
jgi:hypothetical protein